MRVSVERRAVEVAAWALVALAAAPVIATVPAAFTANDYMSLPEGGTLSLRHVRAFLTWETGWLSSFGDTLLVAALTTLLSLAIGAPAAIAIWRLEGCVGQALLLFVMTPMMVPLVALALGTYAVWVRVGLFDTYAGLVIAHAVQAAPFVVIPLLGALAAFDPALERASASLGASTARFVMSVVLPTLRPAIASAAALAFMVSWSELVVALFATGREVTTLPKRLWSGTLGGQDPVVAVAAAVMTLGTALFLLARVLRRP